jgi:hypothetical protein
MDSTLYRKIVGLLMYLKNKRLDICFVMKTLSQNLEQPGEVHLISSKHVLNHLKGTLDHSLWYRYDHEFGLYGYSDSDWVDNIIDRKTTSVYCFSLGSSMVSWTSRKQSCVALNTAEAQYVATCVVRREAIWLWKLLSWLFGLKLEATYIWCENQSFMKLS